MIRDKTELAGRMSTLVGQGYSMTRAAFVVGAQADVAVAESTLRWWWRTDTAFRGIVDGGCMPTDRTPDESSGTATLPVPPVAKPSKQEVLEGTFLEKLAEATKLQPHISFSPTYKLDDGDGEQMANLIVTDLHCGRKTKSYNSEVYMERVQTLFQKTVALIEKERQAGYTINRLNIFDLGDNLQGERVGRQGRMQDFEFGVPEQLAMSVRVQTEFIYGLSRHIPDIRVYSSPGNHGNLDMHYSTGSNWDAIRIKLIAANFYNNENVSFTEPEDMHDFSYQTADIGPWRFAYAHGDCISSTGGHPYGAIVNKVGKFQSIEAGLGRPFQVFMMGHFHHSFFVNQNHVRIFMAGTAVTGDEYAKGLGYDAEPAQWLFGSNDKRPVTFTYEINLAERNG